MALLAVEDDDALRQHFTTEQWQRLYPHITQKRKQGHVLWRHDDGEISMARTIGADRAAIAFAGMYQYDDKTIVKRLDQLNTLTHRLNEAVII